VNFVSSPMLMFDNYLLYFYVILFISNHVGFQIIDIKPLELLLRFGVNVHGRIHITEVNIGL
jgi:hypothetical protein